MRHYAIAVVLLMMAVLMAACSDDAPQNVASKPPLTSIQSAPSASVEPQPSPTAVIPLDQKTSLDTDNHAQVLETFEVGNDVYVRSLVADTRTNTLWVGTSLGAHEIDLVTRDVRNTLTRQSGMANEYVFAALVDSQGDKWFGTNGGGLSRYNKGEWQTYFPMHGLADYWVYSLAEQADGTLWIGTWAGVNRFDSTREQLTTYVKELVNEWVYGVSVDTSDRVWFGTEGGVSMFDGDQWHAWTHEDGIGASNDGGLPPSTNTGLGTRSRHDLSVMTASGATYNPGYVFCLLASKDDTIWAGTWGGGVSYYDGQQWRNYTAADGLAGNVVYSIAEGRDGVMWFGTDKGLSSFDGDAWTTIDASSGLLGDSVYAVVVVPGGDIWTGAKGGVTRVGYKAGGV